jgi:SAM-dependent methyltransferase
MNGRDPVFANVEQAEFWSELAPAWLELEDQLEEVGGPPGELAMDRLELVPGQRVVDLGCGSGRTTLELAARAGPGGEVVGVDISAEMLARGRERAARLGAGNVEFLHADAQVHDFGEARFDAAYSRFGVMFFTDPVAAFANVRRALRPGGVLSFVCWQSVFDNEWALVPGAAVATVTGSLPPMPGPAEPGPFSLADPFRVRAVLDAAGFDSVAIAPHADQVLISEDRIPEIALTSIRVGGVRDALRDADDQTRQRALAAIEEALRARLQDGEARVSRGVLLVTGNA